MSSCPQNVLYHVQVIGLSPDNGRMDNLSHVRGNKTRRLHGRPWDISSHVCGDHSRYFKPKHDVFLSIT